MTEDTWLTIAKFCGCILFPFGAGVFIDALCWNLRHWRNR